MNLSPVTDPELLAQLGVNSSPVTDAELLKQLNDAGDEDPGALESGALGLMSGIPLAETATAGLKSAFGDKTYEEEHKSLEDLRDKAWEKHPIAYGTGKGAGIVGTTLLAPESTVGRVALAAGMGAGSGIDASTTLAEAPGNAVKGAGVGAVLGSVAEGASSLIGKVLPKAAKGAVSSMAGGPENVETYLADRAGVNSALDKTASAEKLASGVNRLKPEIERLSDEAVSKLRPDVAPITVPIVPPTPKPTGLLDAAGKEVMAKAPLYLSKNTPDLLSPLFAPVEKSLTVNGVAVGQAQKNALSALQGYKNSLTEIAAQNSGKIPETALGKIVRDMQHDVNWNVDDKVVNSAKKQLEGTINDLLKTSNPEYGAAMEPVSEKMALLGDAKQTFRLDTDNEGNIINSDTTNQKMGTITDEGKSNAQELLQKLGDFTGFDFLKNADLNRVRTALNEGGKSNPILNVLGHTGGYVAGRMTNIPGGGLVGSLIGGTATHALDGGQIAKSLMDTYLNGMERVTNNGTKAALQKYGPILVRAAKQGGNQLAATHFVLATSHPEYSRLIEDSQDQSDHKTSSSY